VWQVPTSAEVEQLLTGPGGAFEVVDDVVRGVAMRVYRNRMLSLREIAANAQGHPEEEMFIVHRDRRVSFRRFVELSNSVSRSLSEMGMERGDRVAVLSANNLEWCLTFWGTVDIGSVLVGLNGWWKTDEILYGLQHSGARVLIADQARLGRVVGELDRCPSLECVYAIDDLIPSGTDTRIRPFSDLTAAPSAEMPHVAIEEDDPAVIFYTSGTTGRPKGAVSTHRSMIANLQETIYGAVASTMADEGAGLGGGQMVALLTSPLFHVSGCHSGLVVGLALGIRLVIPDGRFEPEKAMQLIQDEKVTLWATVPTMVWRVVEDPARRDFDLTSVVQIAYGGSPSAAELQRRVKETFPNVKTLGNAYGLTESSSVATVNSGADLERRPESVGRPMPVVDVKVVDDSGNKARVGSVGEIWIKGPIVMPCYWNDPEATAEVITDGWLHSGDIGYVDQEGYLFLTDRAKDMIIRGGENVYCVEIENRLADHPAVAEAAVIGVPHPVLGEEVKAVVRVEPGATITPEEARAWVAETLADFKVPMEVEVTAELLPRNASGKLLKNVLRGEGDVGLAELL
jgi:steroid-24-oyl-CoA synthetase